VCGEERGVETELSCLNEFYYELPRLAGSLLGLTGGALVAMTTRPLFVIETFQSLTPCGRILFTIALISF
jgi:hypothetical protein